MAGSGGGTHGFLFADLRGYTGLVESRGAHAASELLERYRGLTRRVVAEHGGAEIKTEGDSFYVVLPSASGAVRCGLALVAACAAPPDGGEAIVVGVGIHAGEAVAHEGGYVGSAVNIAARVCAVASPGQLLATGTVRELTRSVVDARFLPAGRRTLKGLADPVELYRVQGPGGTSTVRRRALGGATIRGRSLSRVGASMAALAVVTALVIGGLLVSRGASSGSITGPTAGAQSSTSDRPSAAGSIASDPHAFPTSDEAVLLARLPPSITRSCSRGSNPAPAALVSIDCKRLPGLTSADIHVRWFRDTPITASARLNQLAADRGLPGGECTNGAEARGGWGGGSVPMGTVVCFYPDSIFNAEYLYWSYDGEGILVEAMLLAHDLAGLETWWKSNVAGLIADAQPRRSSPSS
ncbi:MAG: adenylate/guanylate cyclase domain-containing protein [Candidatus Limnocylindrales bacterium]